MTEQTARVRASTHRLIASRYPPIGVFDDLPMAEPRLDGLAKPAPRINAGPPMRRQASA
jgi:hypothetical protein